MSVRAPAKKGSRTKAPRPSVRKPAPRRKAAPEVEAAPPAPDPRPADPYAQLFRADLPPAESGALPALINYIRDGRCVLFVGAGLSRSAGLPSWHELMERLLEPLRSRSGAGTGTGDAVTAQLDALLEKGRYPELAGHCRDLLGTRVFDGIVRRELQPRGELPEIYRAIVETPFACIVTTNFDTNLEDAYARWDERGIPKTPTGADLAQQGTLLLDGAFFVLKAHGDLGDAASMIFTAEDYRRVIHANPAFQAVLNSILLTHAVLFVGYSLGDPNFRLLMDSQLTIFNEEVPPRYAVMSEIGQVEQDILWRTARIRVLPYAQGRHEEVGRLLHTLRDRVKARVAKPAATPAAPPAVAPPASVRRSLGLPPAIPTARLSIRSRGERLDFDLVRERDGRGELVFSGGGRRPALDELEEKIGPWRSEWTLNDVSKVGAFLLHEDYARLADHLAELPGHEAVVLDCSPEAAVLPWEWLIVEGTPLCLRSPVVRRSAGLGEKARGLRFVNSPLRALVIADTRADASGIDFGPLPDARKEAEGVKKVLEGGPFPGSVTLLMGKDASYERVIREVESGEYDVVHFAGHAGCTDDESFLVMSDGFVRSSELVSLLNRRPPAFMMLNSEVTAFVPPIVGLTGSQRAARPGDGQWPRQVNSRGFDLMAARAGVSAFIGVFRSALLDEPAAQLAREVYGRLLLGEPAAVALLNARRACVQVREATGCFYTLSGHPHLRLADAPR